MNFFSGQDDFFQTGNQPISVRHLYLSHIIIINTVQKHFAKFNALFLFSAIKIANIKSREIWLRQNREIKYARK